MPLNLGGFGTKVGVNTLEDGIVFRRHLPTHVGQAATGVLQAPGTQPGAGRKAVDLSDLCRTPRQKNGTHFHMRM